MTLQLKGEPVYEVYTLGNVRYSFDMRYAAHHRADDYATDETDNQEDYDKQYTKEYEWAMHDDASEARDWAMNNMDPDDFPEEFVKVEELPVKIRKYTEYSWNSLYDLSTDR